MIFSHEVKRILNGQPDPVAVQHYNLGGFHKNVSPSDQKAFIEWYKKNWQETEVIEPMTMENQIPTNALEGVDFSVVEIVPDSKIEPEIVEQLDLLEG